MVRYQRSHRYISCVDKYSESQDGWNNRIRLLNECLNVEFSDPVTIRVDQGFHFDVLPSVSLPVLAIQPD
jgi:hypothetical protein